jgi:hypothetical protein
MLPVMLAQVKVVVRARPAKTVARCGLRLPIRTPPASLFFVFWLSDLPGNKSEPKCWVPTVLKRVSTEAFENSSFDNPALGKYIFP